ncbi:hypothetical protein THASP1DRAFT_30046 [Thamnocephalis sphaerospora]|uniref:Uncharacterized protein n=1 Tax=Thamnocephalis sphaerospora TaxID=78915 RepID=A0A4V1IWN2_9FUNG|nr:hypothetical protein THASP1DRAFT_30046 [Thamnocephalis sphaerospora]|eukprot:RKP08149.1 hypothetical protein THASP1DRAFT_30046 [Thamnocephalis sphaerospora]
MYTSALLSAVVSAVFSALWLSCAFTSTAFATLSVFGESSALLDPQTLALLNDNGLISLYPTVEIIQPRNTQPAYRFDHLGRVEFVTFLRNGRMVRKVAMAYFKNEMQIEYLFFEDFSSDGLGSLANGHVSVEYSTIRKLPVAYNITTMHGNREYATIKYRHLSRAGEMTFRRDSDGVKVKVDGVRAWNGRIIMLKYDHPPEYTAA